VIRFLIRRLFHNGTISVPLEQQRANFEAIARLTPARGIEIQPVRAGDTAASAVAEWLIPPNPSRDCAYCTCTAVAL
jgi:hypothetical protein